MLTGGEAVLKLAPGPVFSGLTKDFGSVTNWQQYDAKDTDLTASGA